MLNDDLTLLRVTLQVMVLLSKIVNYITYSVYKKYQVLETFYFDAILKRKFIGNDDLYLIKMLECSNYKNTNMLTLKLH